MTPAKTDSQPQVNNRWQFAQAVTKEFGLLGLCVGVLVWLVYTNAETNRQQVEQMGQRENGRDQVLQALRENQSKVVDTQAKLIESQTRVIDTQQGMLSAFGKLEAGQTAIKEAVNQNSREVVAAIRAQTNAVTRAE